MYRTTDFDYDLPADLIASRPLDRRDKSRMLVVDRKTGNIQHACFHEFTNHIRTGDLAVFNNTKVIAARFFSNDGRIELLQLENQPDLRWRCMVRPGKRMKVGRTLEIGDAKGTVEEILEDGTRLIRFDRPVNREIHGHLALPPYIGRADDRFDKDRYQTVYASEEGAIAAPTAGLHFTEKQMEALPHTFVTLHVGAGTFLPVKADRIEDHQMHSETYKLSQTSADAITRAERVIAVGTTVVRVLESCARGGLPLKEQSGSTNIFIYPPYDFKVVDALLTNFHLPKSTLLMLVSAFAGKELMEEAYAKAVEERYRFYSYGDCMLIL